MIRALAISACLAAACAAPDVAAPAAPVHEPGTVPADAAIAPADAAPPMLTDAAVEPEAPGDAADAALASGGAPEPEVWLKGSTHVHARPSGDSSTPIPDVIRWYEQRHYDFIVLSDHNQVTQTDRGTATVGQPAMHAGPGLMVIAGIELTHNPSDCIPPGDRSRKCRIHVNLLGVTARTTGKLTWANRKTHERLAKYEAALAQQRELGGIAQINHPNWFWGMNGDLLAELARRGFHLVEIANSAFAKWNKGDATHPDLETVWDAALAQGVRLWGVASDDAHDYGEQGKGKYPAGGGWVVVKARRDPQAILDALDAGRFYASSGVVLERAEVVGDELVVEVGAAERGTYTIEMIENGKRVAKLRGKTARRAVPHTGYLRAVVKRDDGARAWVQPVRR